jgi:hypothetical protein
MQILVENPETKRILGANLGVDGRTGLIQGDRNVAQSVPDTLYLPKNKLH